VTALQSLTTFLFPSRARRIGSQSACAPGGRAFEVAIGWAMHLGNILGIGNRPETAGASSWSSGSTSGNRKPD